MNAKKTDAQSRLYCVHYVPSNIDCSDCHSTEKDYLIRPLSTAFSSISTTTQTKLMSWPTNISKKQEFKFKKY
ncbi:unnamed protein product [Adineta steineri]|uniref:Uncharacterized protein n=1 Tax=Adineta steineri TaxID=433720 RepID=A0A815WHA1_9BILA|nr:unnamed protein product [Adineta steineri]